MACVQRLYSGVVLMLQAPGKLYHRICVISDILPSEWPPVQTRKGVPHPPPTHMSYRAALAHGLEPVKDGFKDMLNVAVASDSRMFRAALVRLVARAAGTLHLSLWLPSPCQSRLGIRRAWNEVSHSYVLRTTLKIYVFNQADQSAYALADIACAANFSHPTDVATLLAFLHQASSTHASAQSLCCYAKLCLQMLPSSPSLQTCLSTESA